MEIEVQPSKNIALVKLAGRIVDGRPEEALRETLQGLLRENKVHTIFDMEGVTWFDSLAIGLFVSYHVSCTRRGGKVLFLRANEKIRTLMEIVKLADRFGWASELGAALAWFEGPST